MKLGVIRETTDGERRVGLVPETVRRLSKKGVQTIVQTDAGRASGFVDADYRDAGATMAADATAVFGQAQVIVKVQAPNDEEVDGLPAASTLISLLFPLVNPALVTRLAARSVNAISLDRIPRTTLAQAMDVLSSQATIAGYRAVILGAAALPKFFPLLMTAAGRINPARALVLGAGVAGLQAIGIARRLGAVVEAYDVRAAVKEQVESLGATFVDIGMATDAETAGGYAKEVGEDVQRRANEVLSEHLKQTDLCITTALIPGRPAPKLLTAEMVRNMPPGAVVVDIAAEQGGNCELTRAGETVEVGGVRILGPRNLPSDVPHDASQMFSRNVEKLLLYMLADGELCFDFDKEIVRGCVTTFDGKIVDAQVAEAAA